MNKGAGQLKAEDKTIITRFRRLLLEWDRRDNLRKMPWKGEKDPYKIWLSEIILQQTRVEQGWNYYEKFVDAYATVTELASAPEDEIFRLWEGLGYYSRCRNLIAAAKTIVNDHHGKLPADYEGLLQLPGIGGYTAAAIASFAYNKPHAVLDGNVYRVIARILAIDIPSDSTHGKELYSSIAAAMLAIEEPARYNQAIMDFGATVCKPVPACHHCFFRKNCRAYLLEKQLLFPVRKKTIIRKERWLNYLLIRQAGKIAIRKRQSPDIWQNLYEFLLLETEGKASQKIITAFISSNVGEAQINGEVFKKDQQLTHQTVHFRIIPVLAADRQLPEEFLWVDPGQLAGYPFPKAIREYISSHLS
jgi:A/G-specific adenine glycosylase